MILQLVLIFLSSLQSSDKFIPPPGTLIGPELREFQELVREDRFDDLESKWKSTCDPRDQLAPEIKTGLWSSNVAFELRGVPPSALVDRVGVSIEASIYDREGKKQLDQIPKKLASQVAGKDVFKACEVLPEIAKEFRTIPVDSSQILSLFVQFRSQNVGEKSQCWMIIEIAAIPKGWPMYPATVFHRLLRRSKPITMLQPHPDYELMVIAAADRTRTPLESNRPFVLDKFKPPMPPLQEDGLSNAQREILYDFSLIDDVGKKQVQIEQVTILADDYRLARSDIFADLNRRLSPGKVVTKDDLNKICAEFSRRCRNVKLKDGDHFMFVVAPFHHGKFEYAQIMIQHVRTK
jgi:hypothetical protein